MNPLTTFLTELALSIGFSLTVIAVLKRPLRNVQLETCGTATRAEFWMVFTYLMLLTAPILLVVFLSTAGNSGTTTALVVIKDGLFRVLLGNFLALAMIDHIILNSIDPQAPFDPLTDRPDNDTGE
jgi:hypothetical protein